MDLKNSISWLTSRINQAEDRSGLKDKVEDLVKIRKKKENKRENKILSTESIHTGNMRHHQKRKPSNYWNGNGRRIRGQWHRSNVSKVIE